MKTRSRTSSLVALGLVAGVAGIAAAVLGGGGAVEPATAATPAPEAALRGLQAELRNTLVLPEDFRTVPAFDLVGKDGRPLTQDFLDGRWTLAFFGYTNCPDVCPITLQVMKNVVAELKSRGADPMQVAFFTVDPKRDDAARMKEYTDFFDPDFVGVTGPLDNVLALTRELGIVSAYTASETDPDAYTVDHTASMLLIDPQRRVRAKFNPPHEADAIVSDYLALMAALN